MTSEPRDYLLTTGRHYVTEIALVMGRYLCGTHTTPYMCFEECFGTITYFACKVGMYTHASGSIVKMNNKQSLPIVIEKEAPFDGRDGRRIRPLL